MSHNIALVKQAVKQKSKFHERWSLHWQRKYDVMRSPNRHQRIMEVLFAEVFLSPLVKSGGQA